MDGLEGDSGRGGSESTSSSSNSSNSDELLLLERPLDPRLLFLSPLGYSQAVLGVGDADGDEVDSGVDSLYFSGEDSTISVSDSDSDNLATNSWSTSLSTPIDMSLAESPLFSVKSVGAAARTRRC